MVVVCILPVVSGLERVGNRVPFPEHRLVSIPLSTVCLLRHS